MLVDCCMPRLSPNAWKVVCYVAVQHLRVNPELLEQIRDPVAYVGRCFVERAGIFLDVPGETGERPYRPGGPPIPGASARRFAVISLQELCDGVRIESRWRDYGTGLSKSSVAAAIKEGLQSGILVQEHQKTHSGRDLPSLYAIDWDLVQECDWRRRHYAKRVSTIRTLPLRQK